MGDRTWNYWFIPKNCDKLLNEEQKDFLNFVVTNSGTTDLVSKLRHQVALSKTNINWRSQYMIWEHNLASEREYARKQGLAEGRAEGRAVGIAEGRAEGRKSEALENAVIAVKEFNVSPEIVAEKYNVPLEELKKALENE